MAKKVTFEEKLKKLEENLKKLEDTEIGLDEAIKIYEESKKIISAVSYTHLTLPTTERV